MTSWTSPFQQQQSPQQQGGLTRQPGQYGGFTYGPANAILSGIQPQFTKPAARPTPRLPRLGVRPVSAKPGMPVPGSQMQTPMLKNRPVSGLMNPFHSLSGNNGGLPMTGGGYPGSLGQSFVSGAGSPTSYGQQPTPNFGNFSGGSTISPDTTPFSPAPQWKGPNEPFQGGLIRWPNAEFGG